MNLKTSAHNNFFSRRAIRKDDAGPMLPRRIIKICSDKDGLDTISYLILLPATLEQFRAFMSKCYGILLRLTFLKGIEDL